MYTRSRNRNDDFDALMAGYYGDASSRRGRRSRPTDSVRSLSLAADTGAEVLTPKPAETPVEEYVVDRPEPPLPVTAEPPPRPSTQSPDARPPDPGPSPTPALPAGGSPRAESPQAPPAPNEVAIPAPPSSVPGEAPRSPGPQAVSGTEGGGTGAAVDGGGQSAPMSEDQFAADMEAILSGRKVFDPDTGAIRERGSSATPPPPPRPDDERHDAIFDKIAQSLEHANSFDLGKVELRRRFDAFDKFHDRRESESSAGPPVVKASAAPMSAPPPVPGTAAFVQDLDAIAERTSSPLPPEAYRAAYHQRGPWSDSPGWDSGCGASSLSLTLAPERSTAMFDTGEHVLAAGDLYPDQLRLGTGQGVSFSYGQVVAMGDFYESVAQMNGADPAELARLKALITRSTEFYRNNRRDPSQDVSNSEWDTATGGRYLQLAEVNYDHFSPPELTGATRIGHEYDNRRRWEELHAQALVEMAQLVAATPNASPFPEGPLITNAFADHFLTDAFASGHLINKESVIARFRSRFFSGASLNDAGKDFFKKVADKAYTGRVAERFSQLEPTSPPVCAGGWCVPVHPNIRFAWMFAEVLQQAAEAEPVKIANLAVKVIHDKLNHDGVRVVNDAGDPEWTLTGDGAMNPATLTVMRKAVQQSVDNLSDPAILVSNLNPTTFQQRVWRFTPRPTPAGRGVITRAVETYTDPTSAALVDATADLITRQLDSLVKALIDSGRMREDP